MICDEAHTSSATFLGGEINSPSGTGWVSSCRAHNLSGASSSAACGFGVRRSHWLARNGATGLDEVVSYSFALAGRDTSDEIARVR